MPDRTALRRGGIAIAALLAAVGCTRTGPASGGRNPWTVPGRFVYAESTDTKSLNVMLATSAATGDLDSFIFSYAVVYDQYGKPVPDALREIPTLENGDVSRDGLTLRYKLRANITFQDGVKLTCADLKFTWQAVMNPANNDVTHDGYRDIESIDCSDPLVAVIHMKRVYAPFLQQLWGVNSNAPIMPAHLLAKYNDAKGSFNTAPFQAAPVGSGPFKFVRWTRGQSVQLEAYDGYFGGKPKLRTVTFKILPDDITLVDQVRTHEIDMAARVGNQVWPQAQGIPGTIAEATPIYAYQHIDFNLKRPMFADVRVGRALAYALDKREMLAKLAHGNGDLSSVAVSPVLSPNYDPHVATYPYNPGQARRLLDEAGWKVGAGGVRVRDGVRLAFDLATPVELQTDRAIETFAQQQWHAIGVAASIKNVPSAQMYDNSTSGVLQGGKYDVAVFEWYGAADPDDSAIYSSKNLAPHGQNALFWNDAIATKAMNDGLQTVDPVARKAASWREQVEFAAQVPSIILWFDREPYDYNRDLTGFTPSPVISPFWDPAKYAI